jgi:ketosteroid isomerase-like protein
MAGPATEEFVRAAYAAFNAGDRLPSTEWWHEDGEFVAAREDPDSATHSGLDAVVAQYRRWIEAYPDLRVEPLDVRVGPNDHVFLWVRFAGQGAGSGLPIDMELAHVVTLRDGRIARIEEYFDRDEGLAAAGLA